MTHTIVVGTCVHESGASRDMCLTCGIFSVLKGGDG